MPFDSTPQIETKADPFSLQSLIAWLETKDRSTHYDPQDGVGCVLCQWTGGVYGGWGTYNSSASPHGIIFDSIRIEMKVAQPDQEWAEEFVIARHLEQIGAP